MPLTPGQAGPLAPVGQLPQQPPMGMPQQPPMGMPQQPPMGGAPGAPGGLDQGTVDAILSMQQMAPQQAAIARQQKLADLMRSGAAGQLEGTHTGRAYQAPGIANLAASLAGNYMAGRQEDDAALRSQNLGAQKSDAMRRYFNSLTGRKDAALPHMGDEGE